MCNNTLTLFPLSISLTCFSSHPLWAKKKYSAMHKNLYFWLLFTHKVFKWKIQKIAPKINSQMIIAIFFCCCYTCVKEFAFFCAKLSINLAIIRNNFCEHAMTANSTAAAAFMLFESANWIFFCLRQFYFIFIVCVCLCWW